MSNWVKRSRLLGLHLRMLALDMLLIEALTLVVAVVVWLILLRGGLPHSV